MNLAQENFERAVRSGRPSLHRLATEPLTLSRMHDRELRTLAWDLDAIQAAIRLELNERDDRHPVDLG